MRRVFDVDYCEVGCVTAVGGAAAGAAETGKKTRRASLTGSRGARSQSVLAALTQQQQQQHAETGHGQGDVLSYAWNEVEVRLHTVRSLAQCSHEAVVCAVEEGGSPVAPSAAAACVRVLLAVREAGAQRFEVAACTRRDVPPFGPPFFQQPVKEKALQSIVTAKLLHALDAVAQDASAARAHALRALVRSVAGPTNKP